MSQYTRDLSDIYFLNDKSVISSLYDDTCRLNPVASQRVLQDVFEELSGRDQYISGRYDELKLCVHGVSAEIDRLCSEISSKVDSNDRYAKENFVYVSGDSVAWLDVEQRLSAKTLAVGSAASGLSVSPGVGFSVNVAGGPDRFYVNGTSLSSYLQQTSAAAYSAASGLVEVSCEKLSTDLSVHLYKAYESLSGYINQRVSHAYVAKGSKQTYSELETMSEGWGDVSKESDWPALSAHIGEVWNVIGPSRDNPEVSGQNYVWVHQANDATKQLVWSWDAIGGLFDFSQYGTKREIASALSGLSADLTASAAAEYLRIDGSKPADSLSAVGGISASGLYIEEVHQNPDEHTRLSVGSHGLTLDIDGNRSVSMSVPRGYDGISVNNQSVSAFVMEKVGSAKGGVEQISAGSGVMISPASGKGIVTISALAQAGNYFNLDTENTVVRKTTFKDVVNVDFGDIRDGDESRRLSDIVSVDSTFASMYNGIANIQAECELSDINFKLSHPLSSAFDAINRIAADPKIQVAIEPLHVQTARIEEGFNALCSIILSAKYDATGKSLADQLRKIDGRFDVIEKSLADMNHRLSAIERIFETTTFVVNNGI